MRNFSSSRWWGVHKFWLEKCLLSESSPVSPAHYSCWAEIFPSMSDCIKGPTAHLHLHIPAPTAQEPQKHLLFSAGTGWHPPESLNSQTAEVPLPAGRLATELNLWAQLNSTERRTNRCTKRLHSARSLKRTVRQRDNTKGSDVMTTMARDAHWNSSVEKIFLCLLLNNR